jgi:hypothetical protein
MTPCVSAGVYSRDAVRAPGRTPSSLRPGLPYPTYPTHLPYLPYLPHRPSYDLNRLASMPYWRTL